MTDRTERAQALAKLGEALWKVSGWIDTQGRGLFPQSPDYDKGWRVGAMQALEEVRAGIRDLLAVQPPPPAGTPTQEPPTRHVQLGVIEFHSPRFSPGLMERFYAVVDDLRASGSIVDLWLMDIATVLKEFGYEMEITTRKPKP